MKVNMIENYINLKYFNGIEEINKCNLSDEYKEIYNVGLKSLKNNQEEILVLCISKLISLSNATIEMKNQFISKGVEKGSFKKHVVRSYYLVVEIVNHIVRSKREYLRKRLIKELVSPLTACTKFEDIALLNELIDVLNQSFINRDYLRSGATDENFFIDILDYLFSSICENDLNEETIEVIVDTIKNMIILVALSSESTIKTSIFALIDNLLITEAGKQPNFNKELVDLFFKLAETSIKQNTSEVSFSFILFGAYLNRLYKDENFDLVEIAVNRFFSYCTFCLANKINQSYYENFIIYEDILIKFYNQSKIESIIDDYFEFIIFDFKLTQVDSSFEYNIIKLYQAFYVKKLDTESYNNEIERIIREAIRNENKDIMNMILSEHNNKFIDIEKYNKSKQEDFIKLYFSVLEYSINSSKKEVFLIVFQLFIESITNLDKKNNMSQNIYKDVMLKFVNLSKMCLGINDTENCNFIIEKMFNEFTQLSFSSELTNAEEIINSLEAIGINSIEYENKIITKAISNVIGWLTVKYCIEKGMTDLFVHNIRKLRNLYNLSLTAFEDQMTSIFIGTAFILLGGYTESEYRYIKYNKIILEEIKHLREIQLLDVSYQFRIDFSSSNSDKNKLSNDDIKKFYKKMKQQFSA